MSTSPRSRWHPPRLWLFFQSLARILLFPLARLRVTGDVPAHLRAGPLILAANHVSPADPVVLAAATRVRRLAPRIMATGGLFRTPVVGALMRACGHIRVDRRTDTVARALDDAGDALAAASIVMVYPEGRIGLDPTMWPERGKTGAARLALAAGAPVVAVAQWGAHELLPYSAPRGALRGLLRSLRRRPVVRVHFGTEVDLSGLEPGMPGHAQQATDRIIDALAAELAPLRPDEPDEPRRPDPTRPVTTARRHRRPAHPQDPEDLGVVR
jgi:1-acyl-sn-glycerol-3-phosphate acyltransferase